MLDLADPDSIRAAARQLRQTCPRLDAIVNDAAVIPLVLAAADPDAEPGVYDGSTEFGDSRGAVGKSFVSDTAKDEEVARKLWEKTEELVGPFFA